jgi:hypothetical protein
MKFDRTRSKQSLISWRAAQVLATADTPKSPLLSIAVMKILEAVQFLSTASIEIPGASPLIVNHARHVIWLYGMQEYAPLILSTRKELSLA